MTNKLNTLFGTIILMLLCALTHLTYASNLPEPLLKAPIVLLSGDITRLADYEGKQPVYFKFWATWCKPCREQMPHFEHVQQQYGERIKVIGINLGLEDDLADVQAFMRKYKLTMPTAIDQDGDLAQKFRLIGTPYHLLFDQNMNLVHRGHEADESLDNKLALLASAGGVPSLGANVLAESEDDVVIDLNDGRTHALFFTATWCDWYLADTRPEVSKACINAQNTVNTLYRTHQVQAESKSTWQGLVSRLWTADQDLADYRKKYKIEHPVAIDKSNRLFHRYGISELPQLLVIKNGEVIGRTGDFENTQAIEALLAQ
ncbi:MAG: redoxin domain-containing protein [Parahaliea sp.]